MGRQIVSRRDLRYDDNVERDRVERGGLAGTAGGAMAATASAPSPTPALAGPNRPDDFLERLLKYIPTEVVATYIFLLGVVRANANAEHGALGWCLFAVLLIGTPLYLWRVQKVSKPVQLALATGAFAVWAF